VVAEHRHVDGAEQRHEAGRDCLSLQYRDGGTSTCVITVPLEFHVAGIIEVPPGRYGDDRDPDGDREPIHERDQPEAGERAEDGDHRAAGHPEVGVVPLGSVPADGDERDAHQPVHDQVEEGGNLGEQLDLSGRRQDDDRSAGHAERYVWCAVSQVDPTRARRGRSASFETP